jgi:hypothetical protein
MNVNDLINSIKSGAYGDYSAFGGFPEDELKLLRAAAAYYVYRYNNLVPIDIDPSSEKPLWKPEAEINITITTEGSTDSNYGL